jgi:hypothetical protein
VSGFGRCSIRGRGLDFASRSASNARDDKGVDRVGTLGSICHCGENYSVWTPDRPLSVWGKVKPGHSGEQVVLQRSKQGTNWTTWKTNLIRRYGRYSFKGTAPEKGAKWHVLLRVEFNRQGQHLAKAAFSA